MSSHTRIFVNDTLGFKLNVVGPATIEEFERQIGEVGSALENAIQRQIYHRWNGPFREKFVELLESECVLRAGQRDLPPEDYRRPQDGSKTYKTFIEDPQSGEKTKVERPVLIPEKKYLQLMISKGIITFQECQTIATEAATAVGPLDLSPRERDSKIPQGALNKAQMIVDQVAQGAVTSEQFILRWENMNPGQQFSRFGEWSVETIAKALVANQKRIDKEAEMARLADPFGLGGSE